MMAVITAICIYICIYIAILTISDGIHYCNFRKRSIRMNISNIIIHIDILIVAKALLLEVILLKLLCPVECGKWLDVNKDLAVILLQGSTSILGDLFLV